MLHKIIIQTKLNINHNLKKQIKMVLYVETHLVRSTLKQNVFGFFSYFFYENVALQRDTYNNHCERMKGLLQVVMYICA